MFDATRFGIQSFGNFGTPQTAQASTGQTISQATDNSQTTSTTGEDVTQVEKKNLSFARYSIITWAILFIMYLLWAWIESQEKIEESIKPENLKLNVRNLLAITLGAIIGINLINVMVTKLSKMDIPIISQVAGAVLPLARL